MFATPDTLHAAEDAALARAEWDETFDAAFDLVAGPDDCSDAFLSHVSEVYYTEGRGPEDWTDAEMADAYATLATTLRSDYVDRERDTLRVVCEERAEWLRSAPEVISREVEMEANAAERFATAPGGLESAATFAVFAREPHERFNPARNEIVAHGLSLADASEVAARLRAEVPSLVYTTAAAPLAVQLDTAADRIAEANRKAHRREIVEAGTARRAMLDTPSGSYSDGPSFPRLAREDAVEADAADVFAHVSACGSRFNVRQKMEDAVTFTLRRGGASLALPSKLRGTAGLADRVGVLVGDLEAWDGGGSVYLPTVLHVLPEGFEGGPGVAVLAAPDGTRDGAYLVGYLQDKHARWITPLLNATRAGTVSAEGTLVRVYVTAVTGGSPDKPTRGVNVCITGTAEAVRRLWRETEREAREEAAYESGNLTAIEAAME